MLIEEVNSHTQQMKKTKHVHFKDPKVIDQPPKKDIYSILGESIK